MARKYIPTEKEKEMDTIPTLVRIERGSAEVILDGDLNIVGRSSRGPCLESSDTHRQSGKSHRRRPSRRRIRT